MIVTCNMAFLTVLYWVPPHVNPKSNLTYRNESCSCRSYRFPQMEMKTLELMAWNVLGKTLYFKELQAKLMTLYQNLGKEESFQITYRSRKCLLAFAGKDKLIYFALDILTELSENGLHYCTVGFWVCSPISAFYQKVNGIPIGDHSSVSTLLSGIFNERPLHPRYIFI